MSNLVAIAYPNETTANEVAQTLAEASEGALDRVRRSCRRHSQGRRQDQAAPELQPDRQQGGGWRPVGSLIGLIFFMPLVGMAIGAASGAAAGAMTDLGVNDQFMKELGEKLQPGNAAVFVLVRQSTPDKVLARISQYGGQVIHTSLTEEAEETLREALKAPAQSAVWLALRRWPTRLRGCPPRAAPGRS